MQERIASTIRKHQMLRWGSRIGVAVSGGADSVFLVRWLREAGLATVMLHANHKLRGVESDEDESFVRELAHELGLPILVRTAPPGEGNVEQEARRSRYGFFADMLRDGMIDAVATGHTLDDQAETVLLRFLRGSGTAGLAGIRPVLSTRVLRPLLEISREEIRSFLRSRAFVWREDCSNSDRQYLRNRVRLEAIPALGPLAPALPRILATTAEWAQAEEDYWRIEIDRLLACHVSASRGAMVIAVEPMGDRPIAVQRRILRRAIEMIRGDLRGIDFEHIEAIRSLCISGQGSGRVQVPGIDALLSFSWLRIARLSDAGDQERNFSAPVEIPGRIDRQERGISVSLEPVVREPVYNNQVNAVDRDLCAGTLLLRNWRPGDLFQCPGHSNLTKLKTLFQEFRIPLWERRDWPVIILQTGASAEGGGEIIWARQFGVSERFAASSASSNIFVIRENQPQVTESERIFPASIEAECAPGLDFRSSGEPGAEVL